MWTLACTGTQLKACGNELQLLLPPTHCLALVAGAHFVACSAASSCTRCGQMHYNYNIFKVWHAAAGARWLGPSIMPQRISALSISGRHLPHNGTMVRLKSVRCARLALSGRHTDTHTGTHSHTHLPVHKGHFRCELHKVSSSLVALPAPFSFPLSPLWSLCCAMFSRCKSLLGLLERVFQLHLTSFPPLPMCVYVCVCVSVYAHPFGKNCA